MSNLTEVIQAILAQCPEEIRPIVRAFYVSITDLSDFKWKPPDHSDWVFGIQDLHLAFPDPDKYLGFRLLIQVTTPYTSEPSMVAEFPVIFQTQGAEMIKALAIAMVDLEDVVVPEKLLGELFSYIRGLRNIIVNIIKNRIARDTTPSNPAIPSMPTAMPTAAPKPPAYIPIPQIPSYPISSPSPVPVHLTSAAPRPHHPSVAPAPATTATTPTPTAPPPNPATFFETRQTVQSNQYKIPTKLNRGHED